MNEFIIHFPPKSEPLKYIFGKNLVLTFQGALQQSKLRESTSLFVYYLNDTIEIDPNKSADDYTKEEKEQQKKNQLYASQMELLCRLWSAIPCDEYKINANTFLESSDTLSLQKDRVKKLSSQMIATYILSDVHYCQPLMTLTQSNSGELSYIASFEIQNNNSKNGDAEEGKILLTTGTLPPKKSDEDNTLNELDKVIHRWKSTMKTHQTTPSNETNNNDGDDEDVTIILGNDFNHDLESQIRTMMLQKEKDGLKPKYEISHLLTPIPHGIDHLIVNCRQKATLAKRQKEKEERLRKEEEARVAKEVARKRYNEAKEKRRLEGEKKRKKIEEEKKRQKEEEARKKKEWKRKRNDMAKKAKEDPHSLVGVDIAKEFDDGIVYYGKVKEYIDDVVDDEEPLWNIVYEDGDAEDLYEAELLNAISYFEKMKRGSGKKKKVFSPQAGK